MRQNCSLKKQWFLGVAASFLLILNQCGSNNNDQATTEEAVTSDVTASALTSSVTPSVSSITGTSLSSLNGEDEGNKEGTYKCTFDSSTSTALCSCPGGGTLKHIYEKAVEPLEGAVSFDHTFKTIFDGCVVSSCNNSKTINGEVTGSISGTFKRGDENRFAVNVLYQTANECSGLNVDGVDVGFKMNLALEDDKKSVSGSICFNPPGEVILFNSLGELRKLTDPLESCRVSNSKEDEIE